jgi:hypothetical protein
MIFANATVSTDRQGTVVLSNHRVQFEVPGLKERMMAVGALYDARIFDEASTDWKQGDVVTLLALDNNELPQVIRYRADLVIPEAGPLQLVEIQLVGAVQ